MAVRGPLWVPVMRELLDRIVAGRYPQGSVLPNEAALAAEFAVSRTVLRESVKVLTEKGLVSTWRGRGTLVEPADRWRTFDPDLLSARLRYPGGELVVRELLILRMGIEPELAAIAAVQADDDQRRRLRDRYAELQRWREDVASYVRADGDFHAEIATASGVAIARDLFTLLAEPFELARRGTALIPGALQAAHAQHTAIFEGLIARDPQASRAAVREHMQSAQDRLGQLLWTGGQLVPEVAPSDTP